ncbi:MAG: LON peptidase substrate-binding domain-containing protein [Pirellulales bacterium]
MFEDSPFDVARFSGRARLFPLPNLVLFPHVMQPMHLFEPRYVALLEEAISGDGLIAMAVLAPGWERDYEGRPPLEAAACLCRVLTYHKTEQGTYNVLLVGVRRIAIEQELPPDKAFREARVRVLDDDYPQGLAPYRIELQERLLTAFKTLLPKIVDAHEQLDQLLGRDISLGMLTDIVSYTLDMEFPLKLRLLGEAVVDRRAEYLCEHFDKLTVGELSVEKDFPPRFSSN